MHYTSVQWINHQRISGSADKTIKIWNQNDSCINTLTHDDKIYQLITLPNDMILSRSNDMMRMWNLMKGECISSWEIYNLNYCVVLKNGLLVCLSEKYKISVYY